VGGDGGSQKRTEDHGGSVIGVDEMRARLTVGEGEQGGKIEESTAPRPAPFEAEKGEAGERWGSRVRHHVEERMRQREGGS
jgi:hypothetical protein